MSHQVTMQPYVNRFPDSTLRRECESPKPSVQKRTCPFASNASPEGAKSILSVLPICKRCQDVCNKPILVCVLYLLNHDGKGSEHLEASCEVHDIAPS